MDFDSYALAALFFGALVFDAIAVAVVRRRNHDAPIAFAGVVALAVAFTLAFVLAAFVPGSDKYVVALVTAALGVGAACAAINGVRDLFVCRVRVEAEYRGCEEILAGNVATLHFPICAYEFQGKSYCGRSSQSIGARRARKMATAGTWPIRLDPQRPATFIVRRSVSLMTFLLAAMSIASFGAALYVLVFA